MPAMPDTPSETGAPAHPVAWVLALLLPLMVIGALSRVADSDVGPVEPIPDDVRVVVVGPSLAESHIDERQLADRLGIDERQIYTWWRPSSSVVHWTVGLRHHVFEQGLRPDLVLAVGGLGQFLQNEVKPGPSQEILAVMMTPDEPERVVQALGGWGPFGRRWYRIRGLSFDVRSQLRMFAYTAGVAATWRVPWGDAARLADKRTDLLEPQTADLSRVPEGPLRDAYRREMGKFNEPVSLDDSFLVDLIADCDANGAALALVRAPFPPQNAVSDILDVATSVAMTSWAAERGVPYVDLRDAPFANSDYRDLFHLASPADARFTDMVVDELDGFAEQAVAP